MISWIMWQQGCIHRSSGIWGESAVCGLFQRLQPISISTWTCPLPEMATELNADAVVEPTVMCYGDSVCITDTGWSLPFPEEKQIWMGEYKEEKSQILNLYNRVTKQIADEIKITLTQRKKRSWLNQEP